jgi:hypothetical protein
MRSWHLGEVHIALYYGKQLIWGIFCSNMWDSNIEYRLSKKNLVGKAERVERPLKSTRYLGIGGQAARAGWIIALMWK